MSIFGLLHGGCHTASCWYLLEPELEKLGHSVLKAELPVSDPKAGPADYVRAARSSFELAAEPIVVVGHSLAGYAALAAANEVPTRGVILLCAALFLSPGTFDDEPAPVLHTRPDEVLPDRDGLIRMPPDLATRVWYQDCPQEVIKQALSKLVPQAVAGMSADGIPSINVPSRYILAKNDGAVNQVWSEWAARKITGKEPIRIPGGHSPFLARPAELAKLLDSIAQDFAA